MRCSRVATLLLGVGVFALLVAAATPALAAGVSNWTISQISTGDAQHDWPRISGDRVAWAEQDTAHSYQVATWKSGDASATRITTDSAQPCADVELSGDRLVWDAAVGAIGQIFTWKSGDATATRVTSDPHAHDHPRVSGDRIVWRSFDATGTSRIYTFTVGESQQTTIAAGAGDCGARPDVSGDRIVWWQALGSSPQLHTWTPPSGETTMTSKAAENTETVVFGERMAWIGKVGANWQVFTRLSGDATATQVTRDSHDHERPRLSGNRLAWLGKNDGGDYQVFTWRVADPAVSQITTSGDHEEVDVDGDRIVWTGKVGANYQVFAWRADNPTPTQLTFDPRSHAEPHISGSRITWSGTDAAGFDQIFYAFDTIRLTTTLSKPDVSPTSPKHGKSATFSANLFPKEAVGGAKVVLYLYHSEIKTVKRKVKGKWRNVKVSYWRSRGSLLLAPSGTTGHVAASTKLKYKGTWKIAAQYSGTPTYLPTSSPSRSLKVK